MACHAVPHVMMYQGDARVPLEAEAILVLPPFIYIGPNAFFEANFDQTLEQ